MTPNELVVAHPRLVPRMVRAMTRNLPAYVDKDEATGAANEALVKASRRFNPAKGEFTRFASKYVRGAILDTWRRTWMRRGRFEQGEMLPDVALFGTMAKGRNLPRHWASEDDQDTGAHLSDPFANREDEVDNLLMLEQVFPVLNPQQRQVLVGLFMDDRTAVDLAKEMGVHESRVSQIRSEALARLRCEAA